MPRELTFFIDRGLGTKIVPDALKAAGYSVILHDDLFLPTVTDVEWMTAIGALGYVFISKDEHIERRPREVLALMEANVHGFVLYSSNSTGAQNAEAICKAMPQIAQICQRHNPPNLHRIYITGRIEKFMNYDDMYREYLKLKGEADWRQD